MTDIPYTVARTKRKGYGIVIKDGAVTVRVPLRATDKQIADIVGQKSRWIAAKLEQQSKLKRRFEPLINFRAVLLGGKFYGISYGQTKAPVIQDNVIIFHDKHQNNPKALIRAIRQFSTNFAAEYINAFLEHTRAFHPFSLNNARTKWGSCTSDNRLSFNWRIACLPPELADYIIIHELCHTRHHNHSKAFWDEVARHIPDWRLLRNQLKEYARLTELYR